MPSGRETLTEYEGNKLIVAVDRDEPDCLALEVAYRLAAARVAMARDRELTVDAPAVRDAAEEAVSCLKQAQSIRAALTGIKTSSDKARATLDEMVANVEERLLRVESLVEAAEAAVGRADRRCEPAGASAQGSSSWSFAVSRSGPTSKPNGGAIRARRPWPRSRPAPARCGGSPSCRAASRCSRPRSVPRPRTSSARRRGWRS